MFPGWACERPGRGPSKQDDASRIVNAPKTDLELIVPIENRIGRLTDKVCTL